jgi:hypothetical protein
MALSGRADLNKTNLSRALHPPNHTIRNPGQTKVR